jgi:thioredoxin-like negative regulator of GroEL
VRLVRLAFAAAAVCACSREPVRSDGAASASASPPPVGSERGAPRPIRFVEDDIEAARERARKEKKVLFVDVWAPWCHACLSMKSFVLGDPALAPLAEAAVFAAVDFDKPRSAAFAARYHVSTLPTFLVLDPASGDVLATWIGSASARELRSMIELAGSASATGDAGATPMDAFRSACALRAREDFAGAASAFAACVERAPEGWPLRGAALVGWMDALASSDRPDACADVGLRHAREMTGATTPADAGATLLACAERLSGEARAKARAQAVRMLRAYVERPPPGASVDDRSGASATLAYALELEGDAKGARAVAERWVAMLEDAAKKADGPASARTFDFHRASVLVTLGRADEAIRLLEERVKQLPDEYEPVGRLASVLAQVERWSEALPLARRAVALAYGPRRLRYMALEAELLGKLGDKEAQRATLAREVKGWQELPEGQASAASLADARKRLADAGAAPL